MGKREAKQITFELTASPRRITFEDYFPRASERDPHSRSAWALLVRRWEELGPAPTGKGRAGFNLLPSQSLQNGLRGVLILSGLQSTHTLHFNLSHFPGSNREIQWYPCTHHNWFQTTLAGTGMESAAHRP